MFSVNIANTTSKTQKEWIMCAPQPLHCAGHCQISPDGMLTGVYETPAFILALVCMVYREAVYCSDAWATCVFVWGFSSCTNDVLLRTPHFLVPFVRAQPCCLRCCVTHRLYTFNTSCTHSLSFGMLSPLCACRASCSGWVCAGVRTT